MFLLQMTYDPALALTGPVLGYLDLGPDGITGGGDDQWVRAVDGNFGGTATFVGDRAYDPSDFVLGNYGIDTTTHKVWAVVNHTSQFAAAEPVPEPSTLALLGIGALGLLACWRRKP